MLLDLLSTRGLSKCPKVLLGTGPAFPLALKLQ